MNDVKDFRADLARGTTAEREVAALLRAPGIGGMHRDVGDLIVQTRVGPTPGEVKADYTYDTKRNVAIELVDVKANGSVGTGVTKNVHMQVPVVYIHRLGAAGGDFLLYDPSTMVEYIARSAAPFDFFVTIFNKNLQTINGIVKPERLVAAGAAVRVSESELVGTIHEWQPRFDYSYDHDQLTAVIRRVTKAYQKTRIVDPYRIKGDPSEHDALRAQLLSNRDMFDDVMRYIRELEACGLLVA